MIYRRISVNNFLAYMGRHDVRLCEGLTVVVAQYDDAESRSNRGGKSAIAFDAPVFALYGWTRTGRVDDVVHRSVVGREEGWSEVEVETSDGAVHVVRQGRTCTGKALREVDGSPVKREDMERFVVEELVGLTLEEFLLTNGFLQGDAHSFMRLSSREKRRVVSPWFRTDRWLPRADRARRLLGDAKARYRALDEERTSLIDVDLDAARGRVVELESEIASASERLEVVRDELAAVRVERDDIEELSRELSGVLKDRSEILRREEDEVRSAGSEFSRKQKRVRKLEEDLEEARRTAADVEVLQGAEAGLHEAVERHDALKVELDRMLAEEPALEQDRLSLLRRYRSVTDNRDGVCPILGERCDRVERDEAEVRKVKAEGRSVKARLSRLRAAVDTARSSLDDAVEAVASRRVEVRRLDRLRARPTVEQVGSWLAAAEEERDEAKVRVESVRDGGSTVARLLEELDRKASDLGSRIENGRRFDEVFQELNLKLEDLKAEHDSLMEELTSARTDLEIHTRADERRSEIESEQKGLWQRVVDLTWTHYAFSAVGIPSREMENAFGVAEDAMNGVLDGLGTHLRVRFTPSRELKDWEPACVACGEMFRKGERKHVCLRCGVPRRRKRRDELRMEVLDGEHVGAFESDSGGGKALLSLGVRLGLARLPAMVRKVRCQHLLVDEVDGELDEPNRDALHRLMRDRLGSVGVRQVLLVTHSPARESFRNVVEVVRVRSEDRSEVRNV